MHMTAHSLSIWNGYHRLSFNRFNLRCIFRCIDKKSLKNCTKLLVSMHKNPGHMQCFYFEQTKWRTGAHSRNTDTMDSIDVRCFYSHIGTSGIHIRKPSSNQSFYIFTLVQKVKHRVYKIHAFVNKAMICQDSSSYFN